MAASRTVAVVGGGAFGLTSAIELRRRGWDVSVADPGPLPHPLASSTDISKAVRMDYGTDAMYADLARRAIEGWRELDRRWGGGVFHETGILLLSGRPFAEGGFEASSYAMMCERGVPVERMDRRGLARRFPTWRSADAYAEAYFNPCAGWVASGAAVARLAEDARALGVRIVEARVRAWVPGAVELTGGEHVRAEAVVVAAGAWTPWLLPWVADRIRATGQPVVHFDVDDPAPWRDERFPVWCADIARTGWYGFPVTADGVLKVGHHGAGRPIEPGDPLDVSPEQVERCRAFVSTTFPSIGRPRVRGTRLCLYADTFDGDFLVDRDPDRPGLVVAAGGSGHGFKFAPLLGGIVADVVEGRTGDRPARWAWRPAGAPRTEGARHGAGG